MHKKQLLVKSEHVCCCDNGNQFLIANPECVSCWDNGRTTNETTTFVTRNNQLLLTNQEHIYCCNKGRQRAFIVTTAERQFLVPRPMLAYWCNNGQPTQETRNNHLLLTNQEHIYCCNKGRQRAFIVTTAERQLLVPSPMLVYCCNNGQPTQETRSN